MMKVRGAVKKLLCMGVLAAGLAIGQVSWANSLTFQDVTFNLTDNGVGTLNLNITNALNASGDWAGIQYIYAFSLKSYGAGSFTSVTGGGWSFNALELNGIGGCDGGSSGGTCFYRTTSPLSLTNNMSFGLNYTGTLDLTLPHLKVFFMKDDDQEHCTGMKDNQVCKIDATGSLLSKDIPKDRTPPVPEPSTVILLGSGLVGLGAWKRRKSS